MTPIKPPGPNDADLQRRWRRFNDCMRALLVLVLVLLASIALGHI